MTNQTTDDNVTVLEPVCVTVPRAELSRLIAAADTAALLLKKEGYPDRARRLERLYLTLGKRIGLDAIQHAIARMNRV